MTTSLFLYPHSFFIALQWRHNKFAYQITGVTIIYSTICSGADKKKHQSSASLAFVTRIDRWTVNSPQKGPVTRQKFPFDDVIIYPSGLVATSLMIIEMQCKTRQLR